MVDRLGGNSGTCWVWLSYGVGYFRRIVLRVLILWVVGGRVFFRLGRRERLGRYKFLFLVWSFGLGWWEFILRVILFSF